MLSPIGWKFKFVKMVKYINNVMKEDMFAILLLDSVTNGIIVLLFAFLVSPIGLPMLAAWMIGLMQKFRYFMQSAVYG